MSGYEMWYGFEHNKCESNCPLCVLDEDGKGAGYRSIFNDFFTIFCESGCCSSTIPFSRVKATMDEMDSALRWEANCKFSDMCDKDPRNVVIIPMLLDHNGSKWVPSMEMDMPEEDRFEIWKGLIS